MDTTNHNTETRTNKHLSKEERCYIERRLSVGASISSIAADLQRSRTTIYYEIKRGTVDQIKKDKLVSLYFAETGQQAYEKSRAGSFSRLKINNARAFLEWAKHKIQGPDKWSIDACVGVARKEKLFTSDMMVCTKTLYNYVHEDLFLPILGFPCIVKRKRTKYIQRTRKRNLGLSIDDRSPAVDERTEFGHWEVDTIRGKKGKEEPVLVTLAERKTRFNVQLLANSASASDVTKAIVAWLGTMVKESVKSITSDNGSEFANLTEGCRAICPVYFAHPNSPWQRGTNERHNGLLRRFIPKGKALSDLSIETLEVAHNWINQLPRKILGYKTPEEMFIEEISKLLC